jgi:hypothetical protein
MLEYKLEQNKSASISLSFCCEVCGTKQAAKNIPTSINEFYKDGTIKIHYTCSNHIVDLYNKIVKEIENK